MTSIVLLKEGRIRTLFQPIVSLADGSVFGYEALSRGPIGTRLESADALFSTAAERGVSRPARAHLPFPRHRQRVEHPTWRLPVPEHQPTRASKSATKLCRATSSTRTAWPQERIVLEITEKQAIEDFDLFKRTLLHYNRQGFKVAIDDAGAGHNSLRAVTEVRPALHQT